MGKQQPAKGGSKEKSGGDKGGLKTCKEVKARHILCAKESKSQECYKKLQEGWLDEGKNVPESEFGKLAMEYSECSSGKKGGDLGWFPRGKMVGAFQDVAFGNEPGKCSAPFKTQHGYHIVLVTGRRN